MATRRFASNAPHLRAAVCGAALALIGGTNAAQAQVIGHYTFDGGSGNVADQSDAGNGGTPYGATYVKMKHGYALAFDGKGAYGKFAHRQRGNVDANDFAVEFWLKLDSFEPGTVMGKKGPTPDAKGWLVEVDHDRMLAVSLSDGSEREQVRAPWPDTDWHHVTVTRQGPTLSLYIDGQQAAQGKHRVFGADVTNDEVFLHLGKVIGFNSFHGMLDDVRIGLGAVHERQVAARYDSALKHRPAPDDAAVGDPLVVHYTFDPGDPDTASDQSTYGNDAKVVDGEFLREVDGREGVLRLNGKTSYIDLGNPESTRIDGDMSFEMWVRLNHPIENKWGVIFDGARAFNFTAAYWGSTLVMYYRNREDIGEMMPLPVERALLDEQWAHVAVVVAYPYTRFYRNGELLDSLYMPVPGIAGSLHTGDKRIGGDAKGEVGMPIDLDEFRLYGRALTAEEIRAHARGRAPESPQSATLAVEPNWYEGSVALRLTCQGASYGGQQVQITLRHEETNEEIASQTATLSDVSMNGTGRYAATVTFPLAALKGQPLRVSARAVSEDVKLPAVEESVTLRKPAWIHTAAGRPETVLAPWTPVQAKQASEEAVEIGVWGRRYVFGSTPLFQTIETAGQQILASPIAFTASANGEAIDWQNGQVTLQDASDTAATVEQTYEGDSTALTITASTEYDGYAIFECELTATRDVELGNLTLDIPLKSAYAQLCYGDRVLPKKPGIGISPWYSGAVEGDLAFQFGSNIWLGDNDMGLTWQAESNEDWRNADPQRAIQILPRGETTVFRANLVDQKTTLRAGETLRYKFALQATPIKPLLRDAWELRVARNEPWGAILDFPETQTNGKPRLRHYVEDLGVRHLYYNVHDIWPWPMPVHETFSTKLEQLIEAAHAEGLKLHPYAIHQRFPVMVPEFDIYGRYMANEPLKQMVPNTAQPDSPRPGPITVKYGADSQGTIFFCPKSEALQDAYIHSLAQRLETYDDDGVYLDGTCHIVPCENLLHGCGYRTADGTIQPTYPVFAVREFMRRIYAVVKRHKPDGLVDLHCSWGYNPAGIAYSDIIWTGEQWHHLRHTGAPDDYIAGVLSLEQFRTEFTGRQIGVAAETLTYRLGAPMKVAATSLLHDISPRLSTNSFDNMSRETSTYYALVPELWRMRDRFGAQDAEKLYYWQNQDYVTVGPERCYATLLKHPENGVLALVSNLSRERQDVQVRFNLDTLGLAGRSLFASNALTGEPVTLSGDGSVVLPLESEQWVYVWLKPSAN